MAQEVKFEVAAPAIEGEIPFFVSRQRVLSPDVKLDRPGMGEECIMYIPHPVSMPD